MYNKAFSLIELMVVIAIVALLAAVAVPSYKTYIGKAKATSINALIGTSLDKFRQNYDMNTNINQTTTFTTVPGLDSILIVYNPAAANLSDNYVEIRLAEVTGIDALLDEGLFLHYTPSFANSKLTFACTLVFPLPGLTLSFVTSFFPSCA